MTTGKLGLHVKPWPSPSVHDPSLVRWLLRTQSYILSAVNYFLFLIIYFLEASKKCILAYTPPGPAVANARRGHAVRTSKHAGVDGVAVNHVCSHRRRTIAAWLGCPPSWSAVSSGTHSRVALVSPAHLLVVSSCPGTHKDVIVCHRLILL